MLEDGSSTEKHRFERIVMNTTKTQRSLEEWRSGGVEEYGGVWRSEYEQDPAWVFIFMVFFRVLCVHVYCHTRVIVGSVCVRSQEGRHQERHLGSHLHFRITAIHK